MREDLLGYVMGALDEDECRRVEQQLESDETLQRELRALRERLGLLGETAPPYEPPAGLAGRTCEFVFSEVDRIQPARREALGARAVGRPSLADVMMACIASIVAIVVFLPALHASRFNARVVACQYNLSQLGSRLISYAVLQPDQSFPPVSIRGNRSFAGIYGPMLADGQFLGPRQFHLLICPDSDMAQKNETWRLITLDEIDRASGADLALLQQQAGGTVAYNLGFRQDGKYCTPQYEGRSHYLLAGDAPSFHLAGRRSANHGGRGQNYLFEDGRVVFVRDCLALGCPDDPLRNNEGFLEWGLDRNDVVLGPSFASPLAVTYAPESE